jgi:hypothetical protein
MAWKMFYLPGDHEPIIRLCDFEAEDNGINGRYSAILCLDRYNLWWTHLSEVEALSEIQPVSEMDEYDLSFFMKCLPKALKKYDVKYGCVKMRAAVIAFLDELAVKFASGLNNMDAVAVLKEVYCICPKSFVRIDALLESLLEDESNRRLRTKKAAFIQDKWRKAIENPYHLLGRRRLLHEYDALVRLGGPLQRNS